MRSLFVLLTLSSCAVQAQSTISPDDHFAWGPNFGWINFLPSPANGVIVQEFCLAGYAWSANFGWMDFGDGTPANGHAYANDSATDYGVNLSADGRLSGNAWLPNAGWVYFEQSHGQPRIDLLTGQFYGHAWCPNAGWIALDTPATSIRTTSITITDTDDDGLGDAWEQQHFGSLTAADAATNSDHDPASDLEEYRSGTQPEDPNDWLQIVSQSLAPSGESITVRFTSLPGRLYRFESCTDVRSNEWITGGPDTFPPDAGSVTERTFAILPGAREFFRVVSIRPLMP